MSFSQNIYTFITITFYYALLTGVKKKKKHKKKSKRRRGSHSSHSSDSDNLQNKLTVLADEASRQQDENDFDIPSRLNFAIKEEKLDTESAKNDEVDHQTFSCLSRSMSQKLPEFDTEDAKVPILPGKYFILF